VTVTITPERRASSARDRVVIPLGHQRRPPAESTENTGNLASEAPRGTDEVTNDQPVLADGIDLVGEYEGSGYVEPHYLARRSNGALVQLSRLLFLVADAADGSRNHADIAEQVSKEFGRSVSAENVATLVGKLRGLGVLARADGTSPEVAKNDLLLGLKLRTAVIPAHWTRSVVGIFGPLFWPVVVAVVGAGFLAFDVWLFFVHGMGESLRSSTQQPLVFLLVAVLVVFSAGFHELGHAAGCAYGGARPGEMGAGVYVAWPVFYTDVTDAYRLNRVGRLRTDLGGLYFNALLILAMAGAYLSTRYEPLLLVCFVLQIQIVQQMLPVLRLDGYYVLSDAVGVPDLFRRIGPILRSAIPFRRPEPEVTELKRHVRVVVTAWVLTVIPLLLANLVYLLLSAPRLVATGWDTGARLWGQLSAAAGPAQAGMATVQLIFLVIPFLGLSLMTLRVGKRLAQGAWRWSRGRPGRRAVVVLAAAGVVATLAVAWWPDVRWSPYREGERGTLQQSVADVRAFGQGRPILRTPSQAQTPLPPVEDGASAVTGQDGQGDQTTEDGQQTEQDSGGPADGSTTEDPSPTGSTTDSPSDTETDPSDEPTASSEPSPSESVTPSPTTSPSESVTPSPTTSPSPTSSPTSQ
jgi:putative peptide zinc metalloprotease protein